MCPHPVSMVSNALFHSDDAECPRGIDPWEEGVSLWIINQHRRDLKRIAWQLMPEEMERYRARVQARWDERELQRSTRSGQVNRNARRL